MISWDMYKCECFYINWNDEFVCFYYSGAIVSCRLFDFLVVYMDILNYVTIYIIAHGFSIWS